MLKKDSYYLLKTKNGFQLHSETVSSQGELIKFFDLSTLNNGVYTIELNKEFKVVIKSLLVKNNNVSFIKDSEKIIFKPVIRNKENLVLISKVNFDKKPVKITLFYNDEVIYSETLKGELMLKRVYRLDKELRGNYTVIVYCDDESYSNEFKI